MTLIKSPIVAEASRPGFRLASHQFRGRRRAILPEYQLPSDYVPVAEEQLSIDAQYLLEYRAALYRSIVPPLKAVKTKRHLQQVIERLENSALADECRAAYRHSQRTNA